MWSVRHEMDGLWNFLRSIDAWVWIPVVAIMGGTLQGVIKAKHRHEEKMAMIKAGMDPQAIRRG